MTKKTRKALMMVLCAVALVAISVGATVAYLTSTDSVTNTFTVGNVVITLDEADVDEYGNLLRDENDKPLTRVKANEYRLVPGHLYSKDPTVHVDEESENCYLFVKVDNGIEAALAGTPYDSIETQILNNGWIKLRDENGDVIDGVYYRFRPKYEKEDGVPVLDYEVFHEFVTKTTLLGGSVPTPDPDGNEANANDYLVTYTGRTITVTAYAIQSDGFDDVAFAWAALNQ